MIATVRVRGTGRGMGEEERGVCWRLGVEERSSALPSAAPGEGSVGVSIASAEDGEEEK
jgi:hypothetical protein